MVIEHFVIASAETVSESFEAIALSAETLGDAAQASECRRKSVMWAALGTGLAWRYCRFRAVSHAPSCKRPECNGYGC